MAKALIGHVGLDTRAVIEVRRLQERVRNLEAEVMRLRDENDALAESINDSHLIALEGAKEPALA